MKALKRQERTFECVGYVQYAINEAIGQQPHECQLPAFISYVDGHLALLRVGKDVDEVLRKPDNCIVYQLYEPEDQQRLADSDIVSIHYNTPTQIPLDLWRRKRNK